MELIQEVKPTQRPRRDWTDLNEDGKRLDLIIKECFTKSHGPLRRKKNKEYPCDKISDDMKLAYIDRVIKATLAKEKLAVTVLGVRQAIQEANKR